MCQKNGIEHFLHTCTEILNRYVPHKKMFIEVIKDFLSTKQLQKSLWNCQKTINFQELGMYQIKRQRMRKEILCLIVKKGESQLSQQTFS